MEGMLAPRETAVCAAYMFLASAMWVVNKKDVKHLPVPFFVMLTQALATCVILKTLQRLRVVRMRPWRWEIFGEWLKTGFVRAVPLALNLRALTRLNPETLIVFRTATLIGVTFGDHAYGKRFQRREIASIVAILVGAPSTRGTTRSTTPRATRGRLCTGSPWWSPCCTSSTRSPCTRT